MVNQPPVAIILNKANGIKICHPNLINWSYLNLGMVHRTHIKKKIKKKILANKTIIPTIANQLGDKPS